ncbi:MAG: hypothetical protein JST16_02770 [Bdellovibrionales bacterium]|nr:hypothetical protein [Bdellovibrionales bacterium]
MENIETESKDISAEQSATEAIAVVEANPPLTAETKATTGNDIRDRVALTNASVNKLNLWIEQLARSKRGVTINRKELVNWLLEGAPAQLANAQIDDIGSKFYDDLKFLNQVVHEMKEARARGERVTLDQFLKATESVKIAPPAERKRRGGRPPKNKVAVVANAESHSNF